MAAELGTSGLPRPEGLIEVETVLDIGPGIRPMGWYTPKRHICVEPYGPYADLLFEGGYETWRVPAIHALANSKVGDYDAIYLLDVIEHMDRDVGETVLLMALGLRPKQIVVATPNGFLAQHGDAWGLGGDHWQLHRSGWTPADFPGWRISQYDNGKGTGFVAMTP